MKRDDDGQEGEDVRACSRIACFLSSHHTRTTAKSSRTTHSPPLLLLDLHEESRAAFL